MSQSGLAGYTFISNPADSREDDPWHLAQGGSGTKRSLLKKLLLSECCIQTHSWKDEWQEKCGRKRRASYKDIHDHVTTVNEACSRAWRRFTRTTARFFSTETVHRWIQDMDTNCHSPAVNQCSVRGLSPGLKKQIEFKISESRGRVKNAQNPSRWSSSLKLPVNYSFGRHVKRWCTVFNQVKGRHSVYHEMLERFLLLNTFMEMLISFTSRTFPYCQKNYVQFILSLTDCIG